MCIVFVEYKIHPEYRESYLSWFRDMRTSWPQAEWYEGTEQPGLFVEVWSGLSEADYAEMRGARLGPNASRSEWKQWETMNPWVSGGKDKIHIWQFEKVI